MTRLVAFLRGINLGNRRLKMSELRGHLEEAGVADVSTFLASGNVIFDHPGADLGAVEDQIETRLAAALGYEVDTFVRPLPELAELVERGVVKEAAAAGFNIHAIFLKAEADDAAAGALAALEGPDDRFRVLGREVLWLRRGRMSDSAIGTRDLEDALGSKQTMRNLNTVRRIAARFGLYLGLLLGGLSSACGPQPEGLGAMPARDSLCAGIDNVYECGREIEEHRLAGIPDSVRRSGDTLVISVDNGEDVALVNRDTGGPENVFYTYRERLDGVGYHVVDVHYYEGGSHLLIGAETGDRIQVSAAPVVSPGGDRLVVASAAGAAGYSPNELQVWRVTPDGLVLEWEVQPDWGATNARWENRRTVRFEMSRECADQPVCLEDALLRLEDGEWTVDVPDIAPDRTG